MRSLFFAVLSVFLMGSASTPACAQESPAVGTQPLYQIALKTDPAFPGGKVAIVQGVATAVGDRFTFPNTQILQPISVSVFVKNPGETVRLRVIKDSWDKPERDGSTAENRRADFQFRTYDGF